jgi:hypothetical protein
MMELSISYFHSANVFLFNNAGSAQQELFAQFIVCFNLYEDCICCYLCSPYCEPLHNLVFLCQNLDALIFHLKDFGHILKLSDYKPT